MVKDCYILPLSATDTVNACLLPLDGLGLEEVRPNMLLALIVRTRRKRPGDAERDAERHRLQLVKRSKNDNDKNKLEITDGTTEHQILNKGMFIKYKFKMFGLFLFLSNTSGYFLSFLSSGTLKRPTIKSSYVEDADQVSDDEIVYDPAMAGTWPLNDSPTNVTKDNALHEMKADKNDDDEIYDPESAKFSPDGDASISSPPLLDSNLSITAKMAQINREIERQKAEIAIVQSKAKESQGFDSTSSKSAESRAKEKPKTVTVAGFQGLPTGIASILFGEVSGSSLGTNEIPGLGDIIKDAPDARNAKKDPRRNPTKYSPSHDGSKSGSLGSLSDAELLAKAAAQMPAESRPLPIQEYSTHSKQSGMIHNPYSIYQRGVSSRQLAPNMPGQIWQQEQTPQGLAGEARPQSASWTYDSEFRSRETKECKEPPPRHGRYDGQYRGGVEGNRSNTHHFRSSNPQRHWEAEDSNSTGSKSAWQNRPRDTWKRSHHGLDTYEGGGNDTNSWRDRDMRRQYNKEAANRPDYRERDRDYRSSHSSNQSRYRSHSRSKSREDDPIPPGEDDRSFDRPFDRTQFTRNRSRSPTTINDTSSNVRSSSLQSIDERIANVVDRIPN